MAANLQTYSQEESSKVETVRKMAHQDVVDDDTLRNLSKKIAGKWKDIGRNLGFEDEELDQIKMEENRVSGSQQEIQFQMLKRWKNKNKEAGQATRERLADALRRADRTDLSEKVLNDMC